MSDIIVGLIIGMTAGILATWAAMHLYYTAIIGCNYISKDVIGKASGCGVKLDLDKVLESGAFNQAVSGRVKK